MASRGMGTAAVVGLTLFGAAVLGGGGYVVYKLLTTTSDDGGSSGSSSDSSDSGWWSKLQEYVFKGEDDKGFWANLF